MLGEFSDSLSLGISKISSYFLQSSEGIVKHILVFNDSFHCQFYQVVFIIPKLKPILSLLEKT